MNRAWQSPTVAAAVVTGLTALGSYPLVDAWRHAPYDAWGWLAALVWLAPLLRWRRQVAIHWSYAGLALGLLGQLVDLNAIRYLALATAAAAFGPMRRWQGWAWWLAAATWFPALGWVLAPYVSAPVMPGVRLGLAALGAALAATAPAAREAAP